MHLLGPVELAARLVEEPEVAVVAGHALLVAELLIDRQRLLVHLLGPVELAARPVDEPEVAVVAGHALLAAELLIDRQRLLVHLLGPVELAARPVDEPEVAVGSGRLARLGLASADGQPAFEHVLGGLQVAGVAIELVGERQHPQVGRSLMGLGEGLARLLDLALPRRGGRLLGELPALRSRTLSDSPRTYRSPSRDPLSTGSGLGPGPQRSGRPRTKIRLWRLGRRPQDTMHSEPGTRSVE